MTKKSFKKGFSLIELLIVIAVIGILSSITLVTLNTARDKAKLSRAQTDLQMLSRAIYLLSTDTGKWPMHIDPIDDCSAVSAGVEALMDDEAVGLLSDDSASPYGGWSGPYYGDVPVDPWGKKYIFDGDYYCTTAVKGCERITDGQAVIAIHSAGPNGPTSANDGINVYDADNIVYPLCTR